LVYLKGEQSSFLIDTGCAHHTSKLIVTQNKHAGGDPSQLRWILNTHPDLDHIAGNHEMKGVAPRAILACGAEDRLACQGFEALMRHRYDVYREQHGIFYDGDALEWLRAEGGEPEPIDVTFRGGEHIRLGLDWEVELLHVPGHAKGHLAVYDPRHQALYGADAIHGGGCPGFDGALKLCPTYLDVDDYLATIRLIEKLPISTYVGCHWPVKRNSDIAAFCKQSRDFVEYADRVLLEELRSPRTLREICTALGPTLGNWPRAADSDLVFAMHGHVSRLLERQLITARQRENSNLVEYVRAQ
jgi:glyoxylase-like metal-dependent hydrolase (beta-lactamase superfamily II)